MDLCKLIVKCIQINKIQSSTYMYTALNTTIQHIHVHCSEYNNPAHTCTLLWILQSSTYMYTALNTTIQHIHVHCSEYNNPAHTCTLLWILQSSTYMYTAINTTIQHIHVHVHCPEYYNAAHTLYMYTVLNTTIQHIRKEYRIGTWNVRKMKEAGKLDTVCKEMKRNNIKALSLSETNWKNWGSFKTSSNCTLFAGKTMVTVMLLLLSSTTIWQIVWWDTNYWNWIQN